MARKKFDHVTALHVFHHAAMPLSVWPGVRFTPGGHASFFGFVNSIIHVAMYSYYLLAALGPRFRHLLGKNNLNCDAVFPENTLFLKNIYIYSFCNSGWKRYLTIMQIAQFCAIMLHEFQLVFNDQCDFPKYAAL